MNIVRKGLLFGIGGGAYVGLEYLWRGWSHYSMFFVGGSCFLLLGRLSRLRVPAAIRALAGAGAITAVELFTGLMINRDYTVWDYRDMPGNVMGQICLPFSVLWAAVSAGGMELYKALDRHLPGK